MRIDLNTPAFVSQQSSAAERTAKHTDEPAWKEGASATLSSSSAALASLSTSSGSDIRQDRVGALKSAIDQNIYRIDPGHIADAMLSTLNGIR